MSLPGFYTDRATGELVGARAKGYPRALVIESEANSLLHDCNKSCRAPRCSTGRSGGCVALAGIKA